MIFGGGLGFGLGVDLGFDAGVGVTGVWFVVPEPELGVYVGAGEAYVGLWVVAACGRVPTDFCGL